MVSDEKKWYAEAGFVRGGFYDELGGMFVGAESAVIANRLNHYAELEQQLSALREAASRAKWLLDDATFHDGRYGQQSSPEWQKRACEASGDIAALLKQEKRNENTNHG